MGTASRLYDSRSFEFHSVEEMAIERSDLEHCESNLLSWMASKPVTGYVIA